MYCRLCFVILVNIFNLKFLETIHLILETNKNSDFLDLHCHLVLFVRSIIPVVSSVPPQAFR